MKFSIRYCLMNAVTSSNIKKDDWKIRLRTIADWFLRRYNIKISRRIFKSINPPFFDRIRL